MKTKIQLVALTYSLLCCLSPLTAETLKIPVLVGQTGAAMSFGKGEVDGYTMAIEEWNSRGGIGGQKISLDIEDTQSSQQQTVTVFRRLALNHPPVMLGPTWLDGFQAIIPLAKKQQILLVTPSAAREAFSPENSTWPVTFYHNSTLEIKMLVGSLKERGYEKIGLIYEQEPFAEMIRKLVIENEPTLIADIGVQTSTTSFQSVISNLRSRKPDVLIVFVWDERSLLSLLQQLHTQIRDLPLATVHDGEGWLANPAFRVVLPRLLHTKFIIPDESFKTRFKKRFGYAPILTASNAYDALNAVLAARAAGKNSAEEIRNYLTTQVLETATFGKFKFDVDGSVPSKVAITDFDAKKDAPSGTN